MRFLVGFALLLCAGSLPAQVALLSDVAVSVSASPSTNLRPGEPIVFTITVTNNGPATLTDFGIVSADEYPEQIDLSAALSSDCSDIHLAVVDGTTTYWYAGQLASRRRRIPQLPRHTRTGPHRAANDALRLPSVLVLARPEPVERCRARRPAAGGDVGADAFSGGVVAVGAVASHWRVHRCGGLAPESVSILTNRKRIMRFLFGFVVLLCAGSLPAQVVLMSDVSVSVTTFPSANLIPGEPIVFTVTVTNNGPVALTEFAVDSAYEYPDQIDTTALATDCSDMEFSVVDGQRTYWYLESWYPTDTSSLSRNDWPLAVGESRSCHVTLALAPAAPETMPFDFHLTSYWHDPNPSNDVGRVILQRAVTSVPTLSPAALLLLALLLLSRACIGAAIPRRRSRPVA